MIITLIDFDSDAENVPATTSCTAARFYKEDIRMARRLLQSLQFTITMPPSNHEHSGSNPPHDYPLYLLRMGRMRKLLTGNVHIMTCLLRKVIKTTPKRKIRESLPFSS